MLNLFNKSTVVCRSNENDVTIVQLEKARQLSRTAKIAGQMVNYFFNKYIKYQTVDKNDLLKIKNQVDASGDEQLKVLISKIERFEEGEGSKKEILRSLTDYHIKMINRLKRIK